MNRITLLVISICLSTNLLGNDFESKWEGLDTSYLSAADFLKFRFGQAWIEFLQERNVSAQISGSLVAAAYGAPRTPQDLDIDVNHYSQLEGINLDRQVLRQQGKFISSGQDLFLILSISKLNGLYHATFKHLQTEDDLDLLEFDEDDLDELKQNFKDKITWQTSIDFGSTDFFSIRIQDLHKGYNCPAFLIAGYLIRDSEAKSDREQIKAIFKYMTDIQQLNHREAAHLVKMQAKDQHTADALEYKLTQLIAH